MILAVLLVLAAASSTYAAPAKVQPMDAEFFESQFKESFVEPAPSEDSQAAAGETKSYVHVYGDKEKDNDDKGYHRTTENKGSDGYKHFDSYHKKDGDKYGYETHSAYGNANHGAHDGGSAGGSSKAATSSDSDGKGTQVNYQYIEHLDSDHLGDFNDGFFGSYTDGHGSHSNYDGQSSYSGPEHYDVAGHDGDNDGFDEYYSH